MLQRSHSGDGCDLASTLCKYDLRKAGLFVLNLQYVVCLCKGCDRWVFLRRRRLIEINKNTVHDKRK